MKERIHVEVELSRKDQKFVEQIGREKHPELRSIDSVTQVLAQQAVEEKILEQKGRNLARHLLDKGMDKEKILKEFSDEKVTREIIAMYLDKVIEKRKKNRDKKNDKVTQTNK